MGSQHINKAWSRVKAQEHVLIGPPVPRRPDLLLFYYIQAQINHVTFLKEANKYLPWILIIGAGLGLANYFAGAWPSLGQSIVQHMAISLIIGYGIILIVGGIRKVGREWPSIVVTLVLGLCFLILAIIGTEFEAVVRRYVFGQGSYRPLDLGGGHVFNIVLVLILGFAIRHWESIRTSKIDSEVLVPGSDNSIESPSSLPIKRGDTVTMQDLGAVIYFEAADNYSQLFDVDGRKRSCNYSLASLEQKLSPHFVRVHRKYLINKSLVSQVRTYDKGRFEISFKDQSQSSITSGSTYTETVKELLKI